MAKKTSTRKKSTAKQEQPAQSEVTLVSTYDRWSSYPSKGLTPERLSTIFREADDGDVTRQAELFSEILEKDAYFSSAIRALIVGFARRNWNMIPASSGDPKEEKKIADDCTQMIKNIEGWVEHIKDVASFYIYGYSANEIGFTPSDRGYDVPWIKYVDPKRIRFGKISDVNRDPEEMRLLIDTMHLDYYRSFLPENVIQDALVDGLPIQTDPILRQRFILGRYKSNSGKTASIGLMRPLTYLFMFKNYDVKWWIQFAEKALGVTVGKYDVNNPNDKETLMQAVRNIAFDSSCVITKDSDIEFKEMLQKAATHSVYVDIKDWANEEASILVFGHSGSNKSTAGKLGGEDQAGDSRQEAIAELATLVDERISFDLIRNYVRFKYGERDEYPYYQTDISQALDMEKEAKIGTALQGMGAKFYAKDIKEKFGWPLANADDEILEAPATPNPFAQPTDQNSDPNKTISAKDSEVNDRVRDLFGKIKLLIPAKDTDPNIIAAGEEGSGNFDHEGRPGEVGGSGGGGNSTKELRSGDSIFRQDDKGRWTHEYTRNTKKTIAEIKRPNGETEIKDISSTVNPYDSEDKIKKRMDFVKKQTQAAGRGEVLNHHVESKSFRQTDPVRESEVLDHLKRNGEKELLRVHFPMYHLHNYISDEHTV